MHYTIYQITNTIDNKIYIGMHQTDNLDDDYMGSGKYLKRAQTKYGIENFTKEILFDFDNEDQMKQTEAELVTEDFVARKDTYNICEGGKGGFGYINKNDLSGRKSFKSSPEHTEQCRKNGNLIKERLENDEDFYEKYSSLRKDNYKKMVENGFTGTLGMSMSEETKKKMSESAKGKHDGNKNSQYGTIWITNGTETRKIKKVDMIPEGWYKGRRKKITA